MNKWTYLAQIKHILNHETNTRGDLFLVFADFLEIDVTSVHSALCHFFVVLCGFVSNDRFGIEIFADGGEKYAQTLQGIHINDHQFVNALEDDIDGEHVPLE